LNRFSPVTNISSCSFPCLVLVAEGPAPLHALAQPSQKEPNFVAHIKHQLTDFSSILMDISLFSHFAAENWTLTLSLATLDIFADMSFQLDYPRAA